jgi:hypothetical protein
LKKKCLPFSFIHLLDRAVLLSSAAAAATVTAANNKQNNGVDDQGLGMKQKGNNGPSR